LLFAGVATARAEPPLFVEIPDHATAVDGGLSRGVAFGDADGDGDADLLVANTINYPEFLYRNDGDRFVQVMETEPSLAGGYTEGVNWVDFDNCPTIALRARWLAGPISMATVGSTSSSSIVAEKLTRFIVTSKDARSPALITTLLRERVATAAAAYSPT
jgi:hypothetical protein